MYEELEVICTAAQWAQVSPGLQSQALRVARDRRSSASEHKARRYNTTRTDAARTYRTTDNMTTDQTDRST